MQELPICMSKQWHEQIVHTQTRQFQEELSDNCLHYFPEDWRTVDAGIANLHEQIVA